MKSMQNAPDPSMKRGPSQLLRPVRRVAVASTLAIFLILLLSGVASAHALLMRSDPAAGAILDYNSAPSQLRLWFTEEINPALTKAVVVDHNNKEVDLQNSHVNSSDPRELDTGLHQLQPGFYVVVWKSVSAEDGHATGGNFLFRVRFQDTSIPALPSELPTGPANFANTNSGQCLTGSTPLLCAPEVLSDWLVFLAAVTWVGGMFWQAYVVDRLAQQDSLLVATAITTARRFRRIAIGALSLFLVANITYVLGQAMLAGGDWGSGFSATILGGILLHSSFGIFWLLRELLALVTLLLLVWRRPQDTSEEDWQPQTGMNWFKVLLGLLLLVAMAFSGHAAAAQARGGLGSFAVPVDWLHLLSTSIWVGGIIFIALTLMPAIWKRSSPERARALVKLLPRFSVIALVCVVIAASSGSFNADVQLTSWNQFLDTTYGRTLIIKILLFIVMMLISYYHAFRLRPALAKMLKVWDRWGGTPLPAIAGAEVDEPGDGSDIQEKPTREQSVVFNRGQSAKRPASNPGVTRKLSIPLQPFTLPSVPAVNAQQESDLDPDDLDDEEEEAPQTAQTNGHERQAQRAAKALERIEHLNGELQTWIRREATLGVGVLLCAALLGGLAGSLAPAPPGAPNVNAPPLSSTTKTPVNMTQTLNGLQVTLKVAPDKFGTNSVGVLVVDTKTNQPVSGANVHLIITMVEMDMGTGTSDLKGNGGFYTGQIDLLMGGHWTVQVQIRTPSDPNTIQRFSFTFPVSF